MEKLQHSIRGNLKMIRLSIAFLFCLGIQTSKAQYTPLYSFGGGTTGNAPYGSLTLSGNMFYGMTSSGGSNGQGMIFSIDTNGTGFSDLHDFTGGAMGSTPYGSLTISGNVLYGETYGGGTDNDGNIFSINTDGTGYADLHDFNNTTGLNPVGALTLSGGVLYGTTELGGIANNGVIFSISTTGTGYTDLHDFTGTDGTQPNGLLTLSGGVLYGTTSLGNVNNDGVVFSINTSGSGFTDLLNFNGTNGSFPFGGLTISGSVLYGMTEYGGITHDSGCIFSINTDGSGYSNLHDFNGTYGCNPLHTTLTLSGNLLYGMAENGGANGMGVLFSINTNGSGYSDLIDFSGFFGVFAGDFPLASLTPSGNNLYGMTSQGGSNFYGVIFKYGGVSAGIDNVTATNGTVNLCPNPSNGKFTIQLENEQLKTGNQNVEIYNLLGEKVYSKSSIVNYPFSIDLSSQPNGIYLYKLMSENGTLIGQGKVIVQK